jgi:hypothetical protein
LLRRFFGGAEAGGAENAGCRATPGTAGGGAVMVGANNCLPQVRQNPSPVVAGVPHCEQTVAFNVGSLIVLFGVLDLSVRRGLWIPRLRLELRILANASIEKEKESQCFVPWFKTSQDSWRSGLIKCGYAAAHSGKPQADRRPHRAAKMRWIRLNL